MTERRNWPRAANATSLDELVEMLDGNQDFARYVWDRINDWHAFVPTFGGSPAGDAVDGAFVLSWDESRVLWMRDPDQDKVRGPWLDLIPRDG